MVEISVLEIKNLDKKYIIDIREEEELLVNKIEGLKNVAMDTLLADPDKYINKDETFYLMCRSGVRSLRTTNTLNSKGYKVISLKGGILAYEKEYINLDSSTLKSGDCDNVNIVKSLDLKGLQCPGPIMQTFREMEQINTGDSLEITVTDSGFCEDIKSWCIKSGNILNSVTVHENETYSAVITKANTLMNNTKKDNGTIVLFSGDLDKSLAAMIIAQGAAAMGKDMTVFVTFWGLNMFKQANLKKKPKKTLFEKMFGVMMPSSAKKAKLSTMNFAGMGPVMIKGRMKSKNVDMLEDQIIQAQKAGVKFVACTMSMDLMGIKEEELLEGMEFGGVASYIGASSGSDLSLFI